MRIMKSAIYPGTFDPPTLGHLNVIERAASHYTNDFESELVQCQINRQLGEIETFYLVSDQKCRSISSSVVGELAFYGKSLVGFVPEEIEAFVFKKLYSLNSEML